MGYYGQVGESEYTYVAKQQTCEVPNGKNHTKIDGFYDIVGGEDDIADFIANNGPVSFCKFQNLYLTFSISTFIDRTLTDRPFSCCSAFQNPAMHSSRGKGIQAN